ncbi:MAG: capsule assembly Wzi family protein [candidate division Zixibacteria bacterium]|nr:capsule assembly Wzi family protein [candidate division Zixibacteria bacterium]
MRKAFIFLSFILLTIHHLPILAGQMETVPVGDKSYSWIYEYIDKLYLRGYLKEFHLGTKPYYRGEVASALLNLNTKIGKDGLPLNSFEKYLLSELEREFEPEMKSLGDKKRLKFGADFLENSHIVSNRKSIFDESFLPYIQADIGDKFSLICRYSIDEGLAKDSLYTGKIWRGFAGDAVQAYLSFRLPYFNLFLGRDNLSWGQSRLSSLILSPDSPPMDMLKLEGKWGFFKATSFFTKLDPVEYADSTGISKARRYLSAHRLSFRIKEFAQIGFSETVVYGGKNRQFELYYLNPLLWFHGAQLNEGEDDNTFLGLDFNLTLFRKVLFYGEFLMDDFQIEKKSSSDREPNEIAYSLGTKAADLFGLTGTELNLEYLRINNWIYNQKYPWNRYLYKNKIIGNPLGPDTDELHFSLSGYLRKNLEAKISLDHLRKGEGKISSSWNQPWLNPDYQDKFPSGTVENSNTYQLSLNYNYRNLFRANLSGDLTKVSNAGNIPGRDEKLTRFSLLIHYHLAKKIGG